MTGQLANQNKRLRFLSQLPINIVEVTNMKKFADCLVIVKPDAYQRGLDAYIVEMLANAILSGGIDFWLEDIRTIDMSKSQAEALYAEHSEKSHFNDLVEFMTSGPSQILHFQTKSNGADFITLIRDGVQAIRKKYGTSIRHNCVHASDSVEAADREMAIFFRPMGELS